jgi:tripartite-type tricarboxylate transporter receptor subunit TctC
LSSAIAGAVLVAGASAADAQPWPTTAIQMISHSLDGKMVALAVSTPKRTPSLPDVPTVAEAGFPDAEYLFWGGLSAPAKTPRNIVNTLHDETQKALNTPAIAERLAKLGVQPQPMSVEQFEKFCRDDLAATVKLARQAHIVPTN